MSSKINTIISRKFSVALLGCTMLAGLPMQVAAQEEGDPLDPATLPQQGDAQTQQPVEAAPAPQAEENLIRQISVVGAQRLEAETIVSYISLRPGMTYTAAAGDQALLDLARTELFADYQISFNNGNLVIEVEENPIINRIILEGNNRLDADEIVPEINLAPRQIFTRSRVRADVARIIELYKRQGRFAATVEPQMVMLDQNRVDVIFEISEGPKSKVRQINIIGNEVYSDGELRDQMFTREAGLLAIFSSNTSYDPDRLAVDQQRLRQFYLTEGYSDFRVVSAVAELTPDRRDFIITYVVEEGERYRFGDVEVVSQLRDFSSEQLTSQLRISEGDWYNAELVDEVVEGLTETAGAFGYAFADVRPRIVRNPETLTMDVTFTVADAPRVYVEAVEINGNTLTQDKVIRREFRIAEGDAFSSLQVARTTARINSLGYFQENFEVEQVEGSSPDRIILQANVQENPTGELSLSAGFSSLESFIFNGSIRQNNFRGRGQTVGIGVNYSRFSRSGNISFTEPKVFDRDIALGFDIYRQDYNNGFFDRDRATFEQATTGFSLRTGVPLTEYMSLLGTYTLNYQEVSISEQQFFADFDGDGEATCEPLLAGRYLCDAIGDRLQSILGVSLNYSTLNSRIRPTRGTNASATVQFAGLGGDTRYLRIRANAARFWPLGSGFVGSLSLEGGYINGLGDDVLLVDRFFLGEGQIRGFDIRGVGPRAVRRFYLDENGDGLDEDDLLPIGDERNQDDALGGNAYYLARAELEIPLGSGARELGLRPSVFVDVGSVFNVETPQLTNSPLPDGLFIPQRDGEGNPLFQQFVLDDTGAVVDSILTINPIAPDGRTNSPVGTQLPPFVEEFVGDTASPRVTAGIGVNWNSPFGPFRIDIAYDVLSQRGDETKTFTFNVGTQF
ncbi:outer membrane protein assembly factor BamA [Aurantiacibacter gangjinensis]|uniref:Outer membrane protein assembly factor BamA n=1 Tax=Aurantiacibacter gangjinensis TaxID=502682 RepID=A0A0G9MV29_9SPHN|nr:outer membrane protein assembly factor BamA [Aurantiacibacter gangjinensis]APE29011.1 Outer membrane protein assembly factor YaeT precursor [Aurantiacibacter gangjinensis]KLE33118.1 membrane protein [Aurantiacibacter gangjinensis]